MTVSEVRASFHTGLALPRATADDAAYLILEGAEEFREAELLSFTVFGMDFPLVKRLFGFEFNDGYSLAILDNKPIMGNIAWNTSG
jgi:hypothetical protein